jgi:hypothetical protein
MPAATRRPIKGDARPAAGFVPPRLAEQERAMRKGFLGSIAALAAGAGAAWGQPPAPAGTPLVMPSGAPGTPSAQPGPGSASGPIAPDPMAPPPPNGGPPRFGGFAANAIPGNAGFPPQPAIMPPGNFGPAYDPLGMGPPGGFGPPPGPMYPMPGPYASQLYQPAPPMPTVLGGGGGGPDAAARVGYGTAPHWWWEGEYLLWFTRGQSIRFPLLTTSAPSDAGVLGAPSTTVLVGDRTLGYNSLNGFRLGTGFFGDADRRFGFQIYGFLLERSSNTQTFGDLNNTSGIPVLARPFIDTVTGQSSAIVLSTQDFGPAVVQVGTNTRTWAITPEAVWNLYRSQPGCRMVWSFDVTAGYRYIFEREDLWVYSKTQLNNVVALPQFTTGPFGVVTATSVAGTPTTVLGGVDVGGPAQIQIRDQFSAVNQFNGFVMGFKSDARYGMFTSSLFGKLALGDMHERVNVFGGSSFFDPTGRSGSSAGTPAAFNLGVGGGAGAAVGGVLANSANLGVVTHDRFTFIPEIGLNFGIALTRGLTGYIGGNFIYFPDIVRPGALINPVVSSAAIPFSPNYGVAGAPRTTGVQITQSDRWIGGVNWGLLLRY